MSFINSNIIKFHGKSRKGSEDVEIREQILTLQNLYTVHRENLLLLSESPSMESTNDSKLLKENLKNIEKNLEKLTNMIE